MNLQNIDEDEYVSETPTLDMGVLEYKNEDNLIPSCFNFGEFAIKQEPPDDDLNESRPPDVNTMILYQQDTPGDMMGESRTENPPILCKQEPPDDDMGSSRPENAEQEQPDVEMVEAEPHNGHDESSMILCQQSDNNDMVVFKQDNKPDDSGMIVAADDDFNLWTFLESSLEGRVLTIAYTTRNCFTDSERSQLADILFSRELQKDINKRLSRERFEQLAMKIVQTFPVEKKVTWINSYHNLNMKTDPDSYVLDGKLIRRYNNWRKVINCSAIERAVDDLDSYGVSYVPGGKDIPMIQISLAFLNVAVSPWLVIKDLWTKTSQNRIKDIFNFRKDVYDYYNAFPCLREPLGYTLLEEDFQYLYPASRNNLFAALSKLSAFIESERRDPLLVENVSSDVKEMKILMYLSQIFPVVVAMKTDAKCWRPTKKESLTSFFLVIESLQELQPILEQRSKKLKKFDLNLQPMPVILGSAEKVEQCFTIFDTAVYEVDSPLKAVDLTFKMFHALHMFYPPECEQIWTFLQRAVYNIRTTRDKVHPKTSELVTKYRQFQEPLSLTF